MQMTMINPDTGTEEGFLSMSHAAKVIGISPSVLLKHVNTLGIQRYQRGKAKMVREEDVQRVRASLLTPVK